ncbi:FAD-dependent monooxygenase [Streptomyces sp. NPDC048664]|uniref:FAD-dependent oxidoreductase n=1 Tax=Streptomyces sp. NPDC048664 TaxID=3154505 RepID=UPI00343F81BC
MSDGASPRRAAVVIGGGMTGMLAASVLAEHADVTVLERDVLPEGPAPRKGLPQARHIHILWSGGVKALDDLLPGVVDRLVAQGAWRAGIMTDLVSKAPSGQWFRRFARSSHVSLMCSRDLLDAVVRARVLEDPRITVRARTESLGLEGTKERVTGVRMRSGERTTTLRADLVVDASGRTSRAPVWLRELGHPQVVERTVDAGLVYASRVYRAPRGAVGGFPIINVQANPRRAPGRAGGIAPVEGDRWLVTVSGTRGGEPTTDNDAFLPFARTLPHPLIAELLVDAEPLTDVVITRSTANRRRYYEKSATWPEGFVVLGDAVAGYNPVYGHGISACAQSVVALREVLADRGLQAPGAARRVQKAAARPVDCAWSLAVGQDLFYPGAVEQPPTRLERALAAFVDRAVDAGSRNPRAQRALLDVMCMEASPAGLLRPGMLAAMLFGRKLPPLAGPPLTAAEWKAAVAGPPLVRED